MTSTASPPVPPDNSGSPAISVLAHLQRGKDSPVSWIAGVALCMLLAVAQVALAGYQMGVGNQSIQIAFLKRLADPTLYPVDTMVNQTMPLYPSYFFVALAPVLKWMGGDVASLYLVLQLITSFLTLAAVYWLCRSICRSHGAALAAVGLLVAGHLHALAGDTLYSEGFTHTFAALPIAIAALALAYRGRWILAFAVAGVLFNIHALTSAYALLMLAAGLLADAREIALARWLRRAVLCGVVAAALAGPTLLLMLHAHQRFDATWINLMRIRSADHSFPSTWWVAGDPDLPRFALLLALFVLSWSFTPVRRALPGVIPPALSTSENAENAEPPTSPAAMAGVRRTARITILMTLAVLALFIAGYVFTEFIPIPTMIRLQPFRASRLLMVLMLVHIAFGAISAIRAGISGRCLGTHGEMVRLGMPARIAELMAGPVVLLALAVPWLLPLLPVALVIATLAALVGGHLSWRQAFVACAAIFVAVLAHLQIDFALPWLTAAFTLIPAGGTAAPDPNAALGWFTLGGAVVAGIAIAIMKSRAARLALAGGAFIGGIAMASALFIREYHEPVPGATLDMATLADWVRGNTDKNALFLASTGSGGFRVRAERSLVADWRDGTQLYFCAAFGPTWIERVQDIEPGLTLSEDGRHLATHGEELDTLSDQALVTIANKYKDQNGKIYILLKTPPKEHPRTLVVAHAEENYTLYLPRFLAAATRPAPPGVLNPVVWNDAENFMTNTVQANIEKYRKADVTLQIVDEAGRPVQGLAVKLDQIRSPFTFGASLGFFEEKTADMRVADSDQLPPPVRPVELERMPEVFNGSMIPFSSKWAYIEPQKGVYNWSDLDKYVDYCNQHDITMEFHHLTGIRPLWVANMGGPGGMSGLDFPPVIPDMQKEFNRHCLAVLERYGTKIKYYQVVNEKYMMQYVPEAWKILKAKYPDIQFGISDCVNFWDPSSTPGVSGRGFGFARRNGETLLNKGMDSIKWLADRGVKPDFFSIHGHHTADLWADPRQMYAIIDKAAALSPGMRIHITEEYLKLGGTITGPVRTGILTPQLQAEYLVRYFTIGFSHPKVDLVNLWGGMAYDGWTNTGIIGRDGKPTPAFDALKKLFTETFRSHYAGQLEIDGTIEPPPRLFHGTYLITLKLEDGRELTVKAEIPQQPTANIRLRLHAANGTLEVLP